MRTVLNATLVILIAAAVLLTGLSWTTTNLLDNAAAEQLVQVQKLQVHYEDLVQDFKKNLLSQKREQIKEDIQTIVLMMAFHRERFNYLTSVRNRPWAYVRDLIEESIEKRRNKNTMISSAE